MQDYHTKVNCFPTQHNEQVEFEIKNMILCTLLSLKVKSVQFSHSVMSNSLQPRGLQHARSPCPSSTPGVYSSSCPLSWWCHLTISFSVVPFSSCLQSFPASGSFQMSQFLASVAEVLEFQLQHQSFQWVSRVDFLSDWPVWITLLFKGLSRVFSSTIVWKHQCFCAQPSLWFNSRIMTTRKTTALTIWTFVGKVIFLLFNMLSMFAIIFLPNILFLFKYSFHYIWHLSVDFVWAIITVAFQRWLSISVYF